MATSTEGGRRLRPMNVYVRRGSKAEDKYRASAGVPGLLPEVIAPGIAPTPRTIFSTTAAKPSRA